MLKHPQNPGKLLAAVRFSEPELDFHAQLPRQLVQAGAQAIGAAYARFPGCLQGHAELTARDLLLQRLDIGLLREEKTRDAGDDARFIAPDDGDGGKLFHLNQPRNTRNGSQRQKQKKGKREA